MPVRFVGQNLVDDKGKILEIPYEALLQACLQQDFNRPIVKNIIFGGVKRITGEEVVRNNFFRQSKLFNKLEADILLDDKYQKVKKAARQRAELFKSEKPTVGLCSESQQRMYRLKLLREMRRKQY